MKATVIWENASGSDKTWSVDNLRYVPTGKPNKQGGGGANLGFRPQIPGRPKPQSASYGIPDTQAETDEQDNWRLYTCLTPGYVVKVERHGDHLYAQNEHLRHELELESVPDDPDAVLTVRDTAFLHFEGTTAEIDEVETVFNNAIAQTEGMVADLGSQYGPQGHAVADLPGRFGVDSTSAGGLYGGGAVVAPPPEPEEETFDPTFGRPPSEVTSTLSAWWIGVGLAIVAVAGMWPFVIDALPTLMPEAKPEQVQMLGTVGLGSFVGLCLLAGAFLSYSMKRKSRGALRYLWMFTIVGALLFLAVMGGAIYLTLQGKPAAPAPPPVAGEFRPATRPQQPASPLEPAPMLTGVLLGLAVLLPLGFAMMSLSLANTDAVEQYFRPPAAPKTQDYTGVAASPLPAPYPDTGEVGVAATEEPPMDIHEPVAPPEGAETVAYVGPSAEELREAQPDESGRVAGGGKSTMLQPEGGAGLPLAPDALDAIFDEEMTGPPPADASSVQLGVRPPKGEQSSGVSDSIFDDDIKEEPSVVMPEGEAPAEPAVTGASGEVSPDELEALFNDEGTRPTSPGKQTMLQPPDRPRVTQVSDEPEALEDDDEPQQRTK